MSQPRPGAVAVFCRDFATICRTPEQAAARLVALQRSGACGLTHHMAPVVACEGCGRSGIDRHEGVFPDETQTPSVDLAIFDHGCCHECLAAHF